LRCALPPQCHCHLARLWLPSCLSPTLSVWTHCGVGEREGCPLHCTAPPSSDVLHRAVGSLRVGPVARGAHAAVAYAVLQGIPIPPALRLHVFLGLTLVPCLNIQHHIARRTGGPAATLSRSLLFSWLQLHPPLAASFGNGGGATIFSPLPSCDATLAAAAYRRLLPF
jgi:hypothetical protein